MNRRKLAVTCSLLVLWGAAAQAQSRAEIGIQGGVRTLNEFEETEFGVGARLAFRFTGWLAADAEGAYYPADLGTPAISSSRLEGMAGLLIGPHLERSTVFLTARGGVVSFSEAPRPFPAS